MIILKIGKRMLILTTYHGEIMATILMSNNRLSNLGYSHVTQNHENIKFSLSTCLKI